MCSLREAARSIGHGLALPCSILVARVLQELADGDYPEGGEWWRAVLVLDPEQPWSMLEAVESMEAERPRKAGRFDVLPGGRVAHHAPDLPASDTWFTVQAWHRLPGQGQASGHQLFLRWLDPGSVEVVHSSESHGLRVETYDTISDILGTYQAGAIGIPLWPLPVTGPAKEEPAMATARRTRLAIPEEPVITASERDSILDMGVEQLKKTVEQIKSGQRIDASDIAEAALDIGLLIASAAIAGPFSSVLGVVGPLAKDLVVNALSARGRTAEHLRSRAEQADADADEHVRAAEALESSEKREFFERARIRIHLRRARSLRTRADRLDAEASALEQGP